MSRNLENNFQLKNHAKHVPKVNTKITANIWKGRGKDRRRTNRTVVSLRAKNLFSAGSDMVSIALTWTVSNLMNKHGQ